jgi:20S proteasome subunit beta 2
MTSTTEEALSEIKGGFNFENVHRNAKFKKLGLKVPNAMKTGTTIAGIVYKDGVVLGADTRATNDTIVADKNCEKIHYMAPNIYCCGAGTAADTENITAMMSSRLNLLRLSTGKESRVATAMTMLKQELFNYQGNVSAALVLGGVDVKGAHLYTVHPHGSTDRLPYVTMGSGSLAAMAVFESRYVEDMDLESAMALVHDAICAGIFNDLGSGGNVDLCVIERGKTTMHRNIDRPNQRKYRSKKGYAFTHGTTSTVEDLTSMFKRVTIQSASPSDVMQL